MGSSRRYKLTVSVQAEDVLEARWRHAADPDGAQLIASGSFRVDVSRLIAKLRDRQLADARDCLLPLFRCAAASGATRVVATSGLSELTLHFDGRPFGVRELSDPFRSLAEGEGEDALRLRQLAYGLLGLQGLDIRGVQVTSGGPSGQASLVLAKPGVRPSGIEINRSEGTLLRVLWGGWGSWWRGREALGRLRAAYGLSPTSLIIGGRALPAFPGKGEDWVPFESAAWRGAFRFLPDDGPSRVWLFWLGTLVEEMTARDLDGPPVEALLAGDDLSLDISQAQVVRALPLREGLEVLAAHVASRHPPPSKRALYDV